LSIVSLATLIVAAFLAGGAYYLSARGGAGAWLSFTLGVLVYGLIMALSPTWVG